MIRAHGGNWVDLRVELRKGGLEAVAFLDAGPVDLETAVVTAKERLRELGVPNGMATDDWLRALSPSTPETR